MQTDVLRVVGQKCCVRFNGPKTLTGANIVVVPCKRTQRVGPNNVACCWLIGTLRNWAGTSTKTLQSIRLNYRIR